MPAPTQGSAPIDDLWMPSTDWIMVTLGVCREDAEWLLVLYRFQPMGPDADVPRFHYYCEAL